MNENYSIKLGIDFNDKELNNIKKQLTNLTDNTHRVRIDIDNSRFLKQIDHAKKELKSLNDIKGNNKNSLTLNTESLEKSLKDVSTTIKDIRTSLGTLDSKSGMKSLLSSINQISTALEKASNQFEGLNANLNALSGKDLSLNLGINLGSSNSVARNAVYGSKVRNETLPQLKQQMSDLVKYYNTTYKQSLNEFEALQKLVSGTKLSNGDFFENFLFGKDSVASRMNSGSLASQMQAYKQYIDMFKQAASLKGLDLSSVTSSFSKSADDLIKDAQDIQTGAKEMEDSFEKLKQVFGSGNNLNIEGISAQLDSIVVDLGEIKTALQGLSSGISVDGLTQSFDRLSETLENLVSNLTLAKNTLDTGFSNTALANNAVKAAQQTGQKIGETISKSVKQSINLDDVIDEQVLKLMNEYAIAGGKGSKAFDEIRQSLVDFRNGSGHINKVTSAISNNMKVVNEAKNDYKDLAEYIRMFNASGAKVHIPNSIRQEYGDDYKSMRSQLGKGFTSGQGMDFETFVVELNSILGQTIDLSHGAEAAFGDLVRKVNSTKGGKFLTGDNLFRNGILDMGDVVANVSTSLEQIENAEEEIARTSTTAANTVVQNEERKQQAYRETTVVADSTSNAIKQMQDTMSSMKFDHSSIDAVTKDLEELGIEISKISLKDNGANLDVTVKGIDSAGSAVTEIRRLDKATGEISPISRAFTQSFETSADAAKRLEKETAQSFKRLKSLAKEMGDIDIKIAGLESSGDIDGANSLKRVLNDLESEYKELYSTTKQNLSADQFRELEQIFSDTTGEVREFKNELAKSVEAKELTAGLERLKSITKEINSLQIDIFKFDDADNIERATNRLNELENEAAELRAVLQQKFGVTSFDDIDDIARKGKEALADLIAKAEEAKNKLANGIKADIDLGNFENEMDAMRSKFNNLSDANIDLRNSVELVENAYKEMLAAANANTGDEVADREKLIQAEKEYAAALEKTNNLIKQQARRDSIDAANRRLTDSHKSLELDMVNWLKKNSRAAKEYGDQIDALIISLNKLEQAGSLKQIDVNSARSKFNLLAKDAERRGKTGLTAWDRLVDKVKEYSVYISAADIFMYASQGLKDMFEQVKLIDSAMTELKKVTNETDSSYNQFLSNAASRAKAIGTTIDGLVASTADFARLGYGFKESQELAEVANIYAVVGDEIDGVEGATESLISTMTAFGIEASNSMSIVDKFNIIGNNFAISSGGIGEALERSASSMAAANNSLDETIALITAANTVVQDPESVGTAFKTISMRIRGAKTDLEEAGLDAEGMASSTAKLREEIMALSGVDIMLNNTTFKSTYKIMEELAARWQDLTDIQQASITELIAGKRQGNIVSSLMTNFNIAQDALQTSLNSSGSAMEEHEKYMDSLEAKLSQLKAAWQSFALTFMDSDILKGGVDALKGLVEVVEWLVDNFGLLGTIGLGAGITGIFKYFKGAKEAKKTIADVVNAVDNLTDVMSNATNAATEAAEAASNAASAGTEVAEAASNVASATTEATEATANLASASTEAIEASSNLASTTTEVAEATANMASTTTEAVEAAGNLASASTEAVEAIANTTSAATESAEAIANMTSAGTEAAETTANLASGTSEFIEAAGNTASTVTETAETVANLGSAAVDAGASAVKASGGFKKFFGTLGGKIAIAGAVVAAIALIYNQFKKAKEAASEARQEAIATSDEFLDAAGSFEQAYIKYSGRTDLTAEEEADLESAIQGTVKALNNKSSALQSVVNSSNDYLASLEQITNAELKEAEDAAKVKRDNAGKELQGIIQPKNVLMSGISEASVLLESGFDLSEEEWSEATSFVFAADGERWLKETKRGHEGADTEVWLSLDPNADINEILDYYNMLVEYRKLLSDNDLVDTDTYTAINNTIKELSESVNVYVSALYEAEKAQYQLKNGIPKTTDEYVAMRESILGSDDIKNLSLGTKMSVLNTLDSEYGQLFDLTAAEVQARKFVGIIKGYGDGTKDGTNEIGAVETFLNMRTAVNNNECTVGEYLSELDNVASMSEKFSDEEKEQFNLAFGIDTDSIKKQYDDVYNYISRNYLEKLNTDGMSSFDASEYKTHETEKIQEILKGLSVTELQAVANIKGEIYWETANTGEILAQIKEEAKFIEAMNYTIAIDVETESLDALNSALSESVSGAGLSSESIEVLKSRYAELASQGYDLSAMFEETSNGIHLNKNAVSEFEHALASQKLSETDNKLDVLKNRYDELTDKINNCTDAGKRASLYSEQQEVAQKINDLATLASQYKGLTSAYNAWQNAESAGNERDMYESIIEGFETIGDEISRGWYDDGTIKFLELMTGKTDLAGKSASELKEIWNSLDDTIKGTSYSVRDFFTVDDEGNSTSTGAYNFLRAVEELGKNGGLKALEGKNIEDLIVRNDKGKIVEFDFDVVGGDKAVADALGVSEEMVQIIQRTLDDAGFVVTLDGKYTLLADLKTSAEEANNSLKKLQSEGLKNLKDVDLNFDFNVDTVEGYQEQLEKALNVLDKFRNKDGTLQTDKNGNLVEGAKQALEIAEYYTAAMDKLTEPKFMQIDTSTVDEELQEPIEKIQEIGDLCKEKHLVALTGDTKELDKVQGEIDKVAKEIEELDPEVKAQIGIDEDWDAKTIADKIEKGEIEIPAELKLDVQMSEDLKDMRLMMMNQLGLTSDNEVKLKIGYDIDDSVVDKLTEEEQEVVVNFLAKDGNETWFNALNDEEKEIAIKYIVENNSFEGLDDEEKLVIVEFISENEKLLEGLSEEEKKTVIRFAIENEEEFNKLTDEEKQVVVRYIAEHDEVDNWKPKDKEALIRLIVNKDDVDDWKPEDVDAVVKYYADDEQVKDWTPEEKKAYAKYLVDGGEVDGWSPEAKDAFVKYLVDGGDPDKFDPDDKESWVVYDADTRIPDGYIPNNPNALVTYNKDSSVPDNYNPDDPDATVKYDKDSLIPDNYIPLDPPATVIFDKDTSAIDTYDPPDFVRTVTYKIKEIVSKVASGGKSKAAQRTGADPDGKGVVNGTANVNGTTGRAFKHGSWGTKNSGTALVGELGRETLVRDGRYYTIGDSGAEFIKYQRGDIIFNHKQTEELFKNGRVTSGGGRAKALVNGTAFAQGAAFSEGYGGGEEPTVPSFKVGYDYKASSNSDSKKSQEIFDWIEVAISRIEREIDNLDRTANNAYKSWSSRNKALADEIGEVGNEIALQEKAYQGYINAANEIGLSSEWKKKVQSGAIDIDNLTDETLTEKIKDYQKYYEAALDCKDAIEELKETEASLYAQRIENVSAQYEGILGVIEHEKNVLEEYISQSEAQGWLVSANYYNALTNNEKNNIAQLKKEKAAMLSELQTAMESDTIAKGSEAWYNLCNQIDEVTLSITEGETRLKEYSQTLQQLSWETFDLLQEKISAVSEESEFLIELLSSSKLFDDNGQLTDTGSATMGLHGQNYNVHMYQADQAAKEAERLKKELSKDPYDTELEERYREMISLQQEHILAAQDEKEAIRDMVEEGIELELDALQERIDKYNESIDSARDLYEYNNKVKEQSEEIANLEKQRSAYLGDTSEEGKAKLQQIEVSLKEAKDDLKETEYDKLIDDSAALLDELYLEYEEVLNTRLDNLDALVSGMITQINNDAISISTTISEKADSVGYTLSNSMTSIWDTNSTKINSVITTYGEKFSTAQTTTNNALKTINTNLQNMITQLNSIAKTNVKSASTSSASNSKQANTTKKEPTKTDKPKPTTPTIKVGGMINAGSAPIYDYVGDTSGERQLYRNDPKYKVLDEKKGYLLTRWYKLSSGYTGWFKKFDVKALATGAKRINADDMVWTQEKGQEYIVRPSDGAILTPVAKNDSVLNANASNNIWDMANSPSEFIKDNLNLGAANVPNNSNVNTAITQHFENITFSMPNVHGYNDLLTEMQRDPKFEKLILSMTIDQIAGKSKLAKGKSIR